MYMEDPEGIVLCKISQSQNNKCYIIISYEAYKVVKLLETKNGFVVSRDEQEGERV